MPFFRSLLLCQILALAFAFGDQVITNDGKVYEGTIIEENDRFVIIDVNGFKNTIWKVLIKDVVKGSSSSQTAPVPSVPSSTPATPQYSAPSESYSSPSNPPSAAPTISSELPASTPAVTSTLQEGVEFKIGYAKVHMQNGKNYDCEIVEVLGTKLRIKYKGVSKSLKKHQVESIEYK